MSPCQIGGLQPSYEQAGGGSYALCRASGRDVPPGGTYGPPGGEVANEPLVFPLEKLCPEGRFRGAHQIVIEQ